MKFGKFAALLVAAVMALSCLTGMGLDGAAAATAPAAAQTAGTTAAGTGGTGAALSLTLAADGTLTDAAGFAIGAAGSHTIALRLVCTDSSAVTVCIPAGFELAGTPAAAGADVTVSGAYTDAAGTAVTLTPTGAALTCDTELTCTQHADVLLAAYVPGASYAFTAANAAGVQSGFTLSPAAAEAVYTALAAAPGTSTDLTLTAAQLYGSGTALHDTGAVLTYSLAKTAGVAGAGGSGESWQLRVPLLPAAHLTAGTPKVYAVSGSVRTDVTSLFTADGAGTAGAALTITFNAAAVNDFAADGSDTETKYERLTAAASLEFALPLVTVGGAVSDTSFTADGAAALTFANAGAAVTTLTAAEPLRLTVAPAAMLASPAVTAQGAATEAAYQVRYYQQDRYDATYALVSADTVNSTGTVGAAPTIPAKAYTGFTLEKTLYEATARAASGTALPIAADGSLVVSLYYTRNTHNVVYDANGHGSAPAGQTGVRYGALVAAPPLPLPIATATGYVCMDWYTDSACTAGHKWDFSFSTMPDAPLTLYAKWQPRTFMRVTFKNSDSTRGTLAGDGGQDVNYLEHAQGSCTATPVSADYTVVGWTYSCTALDGTALTGVLPGATGYTAFAVQGDTTFSPVYAKGTFLAATAVNGAVSLGTALSSLTTPSAPSARVESISVGSLPVQAFVLFAPAGSQYSLASITVRDFAQPTPHTLTITPAQVASASSPFPFTTVDRNGTSTTVNVVVSLANGSIITDKTVDAPLEFDVAYEAVPSSYVVHHYQQNADQQGYTEVTADAQTITAAAGSTEYFTPKTYTGFACTSGRTTYEDSAHTTPQADALPVLFDTTSAVRLYYDRVPYALTFDANGHGTAPAGQTPVFGAAAAVPAPLTAPGWEFGGWYTNAACTGSIVNFSAWTMPAANTTLYAKWTEKAPVTYYYSSADTNLGTVSQGIESVPPATGTPQGALATPYPGCRFVSWTDDNNHGAVVSTDAQFVPARGSEGIYTDGSYTANFAAQPFTLSFSANGHGTAPDSETVNCRSHPTPPSLPSAAGWEFGGWFENAACTGSIVDFSQWIMPPANTTLYAKWTEKAPVAYYYSSADTNLGTVSQGTESVPPATGTPQGALAAPKTGCRFVSWTDDFNHDKVVSTEAQFNPPRVGGIYIGGSYKAHFEAVSYAVTFSANGHGTNPAPASAFYGKTLTAPTAPAADGYTFGGWYRDTSCTTVWDFAADTMPAAALTLYAKWTPIVYVIRMDANGGSGTMNDLSLTYGTAANLAKNSFTRGGYTFKNWNTQQDGSGSSYANGANVANIDVSTATGAAHEIVLYAQWVSAPAPTEPAGTGGDAAAAAGSGTAAGVRTGDTAHPAAWAALLALSGLAVLGLGTKRKKKD